MKRVYVNEAVCIGCHLCEVYCRAHHASSKDPVRSMKKEEGKPPRLHVEEKGAVSFSVRCLHCDEPLCVYVCLTGALQKDPESGVVHVDEDKCMGCWTCLMVCPFGAIKRDTTRHVIVKCDLCQGEAVPACVKYCPNEALILVDSAS